jgi:hypothetical protein
VLTHPHKIIDFIYDYMNIYMGCFIDFLYIYFFYTRQEINFASQCSLQQRYSGSLSVAGVDCPGKNV